MAVGTYRSESYHSTFTVIFGPMFSGKTTELIRRLKRYQIANYKCLIVKYAADNRYTRDGIATHDREELPAVARTSLMGLDAKDFDIVGIDEAQFFSDVVEFSERMANDGKIVIVAALDATYQRQSFGDILKLVPLAENVVKLTAVCVNCYKDASFTKRRTNEKEVELIGGIDKYEAVCRRCYFLLSPDNRKQQQHFSPKSQCADSKVKKSAQAQTFEDTLDSFEMRKAKKLLIDSF